jgi:hypothetical protein
MPLDEADKKWVQEMFGGLLKEATKDFATTETLAKVVDQKLAKGIGDLKIDEKIAALKPKDEPKDDHAKDSKEKGAKVDPAQAKLQERIEQLERQNREADERAKNERAQREEQEAIGALRDALSANGVPADRQGIAIAKLYHADKLVKRDAEGKLFVPVPRKAGYTDNLDLASYVKEYLATDEGKTFLPPKGSNGTGDGAGTRVQGGSGAVKIENLQIPL